MLQFGNVLTAKGMPFTFLTSRSSPRAGPCDTPCFKDIESSAGPLGSPLGSLDTAMTPASSPMDVRMAWRWYLPAAGPSWTPGPHPTLPTCTPQPDTHRLSSRRDRAATQSCSGHRGGGDITAAASGRQSTGNDQRGAPLFIGLIGRGAAGFREEPGMKSLVLPASSRDAQSRVERLGATAVPVPAAPMPFLSAGPQSPPLRCWTWEPAL